MGQLTQENRFLSITDFSLGSDTFVVTSIKGRENVSGLFEFEVDLYSDNHQISPDKVVGKSATVVIHDTQERYFNGCANTFTRGEVGPHDHRHYRLTLVPWLWFLTQKQDCRIFQEKNTKDIVTQIFSEHGFTDFEFKASGGSVREYCVQYNESDFQFISRLLEEDGIAYYFTHENSKHVLVIVDQPNAYEEVAETNVEYSKGNMPNTQIHRWLRTHEYKKGKWTLTDYNFKEPKKDLKASSKSNSKFSKNAQFEHYEYPGYYDMGLGSELVKIRLEAEETRRTLISGSSDCSSFYAGGKFKLAKHESADEKGNYILVGVVHSASDRSFFTGEEGNCNYENDFMCIPAEVHFRPELTHQRPVMRGPQSAIVVGPPGEEIYIDELCRIKVQFYWDREGKNDENTTCFIRVMQSWAGNQWGSSFIPRIGHEVIITFLDGDPDRPLVTGSVYNAWNKPVYTSKTQSGIKSRSTKGGNAQNYNELRFEDKKGSEQVYLHAEKDFDSHVENNQSLTVEKDRNKSIGENETYDIGQDRSKTIGGNQSEVIAKNKKTQVDGDHVEAIGKNMSIDIEKDLSETVGGSYTEKVTKDSVHTAKTITFKADKQITLQTGSAKIVMKSNGDITISGKNINVKGSGNVVVKGSKVTMN